MAETYKKIDAVGNEPEKLEVTYDTVKREFTEEQINDQMTQLAAQRTRIEGQITLWQKRKDEIAK